MSTTRKVARPLVAVGAAALMVGSMAPVALAQSGAVGQGGLGSVLTQYEGQYANDSTAALEDAHKTVAPGPDPVVIPLDGAADIDWGTVFFPEDGQPADAEISGEGTVLTVPGQGMWTFESAAVGEGASLVFTPEEDFDFDTEVDPVMFSALNEDGEPVEPAGASVTYEAAVEASLADVSAASTECKPVTITPEFTGNVDLETLEFSGNIFSDGEEVELDENGYVIPKVVPGPGPVVPPDEDVDPDAELPPEVEPGPVIPPETTQVTLSDDGKTLTVSGEGVWTVVDGTMVFTPDEDFDCSYAPYQVGFNAIGDDATLSAIAAVSFDLVDPTDPPAPTDPPVPTDPTEPPAPTDPTAPPAPTIPVDPPAPNPVNPGPSGQGGIVTPVSLDQIGPKVATGGAVDASFWSKVKSIFG